MAELTERRLKRIDYSVSQWSRNDPERHQELFQEVCLKVLELKEPIYESYIGKAIYNILIDIWRKEVPGNRRYNPDNCYISIDDIDELEYTQEFNEWDLDQLYNKFFELSERHQQVLYDQYYLGYTLKESMKTFGVCHSRICQLRKEALEILRVKVKRG